jgi:hypothetical protein
MLNWFNSEKQKDQRELDRNKDRLVNEIKKLKKEDIFPIPEKLTIWKKLKILLLGR